MKVTIVNCFDTNRDRVDLIYDYFKEKGYEVTVIESDFHHGRKEKKNITRNDFLFIETLPYKRNLSVGRLNSHDDFSKKAIQLAADLQPDILYVMFPPNSLMKYASAYKAKNPQVKLIADVIDLWPESMPVPENLKRLFVFRMWADIRNKHLAKADLFLTECYYYYDVLKKHIGQTKTGTLYLAQDSVPFNGEERVQLSQESFDICYLGSINNIIDIDFISELIKKMSAVKKVRLHIIGDGESREEFIQCSERAGAEVLYHGKIYNAQEKQAIFDQCYFGLNIMKETVSIGLTTKSIDYFNAGLPIINNIKHDTVKLVDQYGIGINITRELDNVPEIMNESIALNKQRRIKVKEIFDQYFSREAFYEQLEVLLRKIDV
ncbi:glycosyltransferase [Trichococcus sp. K1Tr]|uniref:glycosyltransferase n=1 Tax=Trichococcus sp. K1Tr TaxID=3020847 RepID=UPI00232F23B0|nr:glycosyltransferase [Trichococcus sp. K1Tr]MDB6354116.1 glycosyltransferase [Trichococcus sp. K1Tr]